MKKSDSKDMAIIAELKAILEKIRILQDELLETVKKIHLYENEPDIAKPYIMHFNDIKEELNLAHKLMLENYIEIFYKDEFK